MPCVVESGLEAREADSFEYRRAALDRLRDRGLLSEREHRRKLARARQLPPVLALAQQAAVAQPVQGRPAVLEAVRLARLEAALDDARHGSLSLNAPPDVM